MSFKRFYIIVLLLIVVAFALTVEKGYADNSSNSLILVSPHTLTSSQSPSSEVESVSDMPETPVVLHEEHINSKPLPPADDETERASYRLGSGDKIKITVFGEDNLSGIYLVNEEGYISFPLIEEVDVLNKNIVEVRKILSEKLSNGFLIDPSIAIEVAEFRPIYIMGEVNSPGQYSFITDMSVRNAVAIAGGYTYRASQNKILVTRSDMDGNDIQATLTKDDRVQPGDVLLIKERFF